MADIYEDLSKMVVELLVPSSQGGFGQPDIRLRRKVMPAESEESWKPVEPQITHEVALQAAGSLAMSMVEGELLKQTDGVLTVVCAPPAMPFTYEDKVVYEILLAGRPYLVTKITTLPPTGKTVAVKFEAV